MMITRWVQWNIWNNNLNNNLHKVKLSADMQSLHLVQTSMISNCSKSGRQQWITWSVKMMNSSAHKEMKVSNPTVTYLSISWIYKTLLNTDHYIQTKIKDYWRKTKRPMWDNFPFNHRKMNPTILLKRMEKKMIDHCLKKWNKIWKDRLKEWIWIVIFTEDIGTRIGSRKLSQVYCPLSADYVTYLLRVAQQWVATWAELTPVKAMLTC